MNHIHTEVCIVGGGPAGACTALGLEKRGHDTCIIESASFPRRQIGESLSSGILPLLEQLGVRDHVENAGFFRPDSAFIYWGKLQGRVARPREERGFQVDRGKFDQLLINAATRAGARLLQPAMANRPMETRDGWKIPVRIADKSSVTIFSKHLVIATGRRHYLKRYRRRLTFPLLGIYGYWRNCKLEGIESRVEAVSDGWLWCAPLPGGLVNAAVFLDPSSAFFSNREQIRQHYLKRLSESKSFRSCVKGELIESLKACDASSYVMREPAGSNWIYVGDAALGIDPLSSQGVQTAIKTAILATAVIHTQLCKSSGHAAASNFYKDRLIEIAHRHRTITERFYSDQAAIFDTEFWRKRMAPSTPRSENPPTPSSAGFRHVPNLATCLRLASGARLIDQPVLVGDFIESRKALQYSHFHRPIAFIQNIELAPLILHIDGHRAVKEIIAGWTRIIGLESACRILAWLLEAGVATPAEDGSIHETLKNSESIGTVSEECKDS